MKLRYVSYTVQDINQKAEDFIANSRQTEISKYTKKVFNDPLTSVDTNILVVKKSPSKSRGELHIFMIV